MKLKNFKWSLEEQVWPDEVALDGSTLYCRRYYWSSVTANSTNGQPHNFSNYDCQKIYQIWGMMHLPAISTAMAITNANPGGLQYQVHVAMDATNVYVQVSNGLNLSGATAHVFVVYKK